MELRCVPFLGRRTEGLDQGLRSGGRFIYSKEGATRIMSVKLIYSGTSCLWHLWYLPGKERRGWERERERERETDAEPRRNFETVRLRCGVFNPCLCIRRQALNFCLPCAARSIQMLDRGAIFRRCTSDVEGSIPASVLHSRSHCFLQINSNSNVRRAVCQEGKP